VWEWHGPAVDVGDAAAKWFSAHLGKPVRLVRYGGEPTAAWVGRSTEAFPEFEQSRCSQHLCSVTLMSGTLSQFRWFQRPFLVFAGESGSGDAGSDPKRRATDPAFAPAHETAFSDGFPYLCCGEVRMVSHTITLK
jgi:hypothetical protein